MTVQEGKTATKLVCFSGWGLEESTFLLTSHMATRTKPNSSSSHNGSKCGAGPFL